MGDTTSAQKNSRLSFRPNSSRVSYSSYGREYPRNRTPYGDNYSAINHGENQRRSVNNDIGHLSGNERSADEQRINDDDRTHYTVNLSLKPVEIGISTQTKRGKKEFRGIGAFNRYFGLLAPANGLGYTIPDVWDGYFHITIAKFITRLAPDEIDEIFRSFPQVQDIPCIPEVVFKASKISTVPGASRPKGRRNIDFTILPIDLTSGIRSFYEEIQPLLGAIEQGAQTVLWNLTQIDRLHVTIRKYSNISFNTNQIKIEQFPLEFRCSQLEIKQTREQAIDRFKKKKQLNNTDVPWWLGVTESGGKCSGCGTRIISQTWEGFCMACEQYESMIPLWSTTGRTNPPIHITSEQGTK